MQTVPCDVGISKELLLLRNHEPTETRLLTALLKNGMYCLDVGANIGYYALLERKIVGKSGKVIALEPSPVSFTYLVKNLSLNQFNDVETYQLALGKNNRSASMILDQKSNLSKISDFSSDSQSANSLDVHMDSLDSFIETNKPIKIDLIRMDIEGYEEIVILNGQITLKKFKPLLLIEIHAALIGEKNLRRLLLTLKGIGYSKVYFIERNFEILDVVWGTGKSNIHPTSFVELEQKIDKGQIPNIFTALFRFPTTSVKN